MKIKDHTVRTMFLPEMWYDLWSLDTLWRAEMGHELTITSGRDSKHTAIHSGHYIGTAVDIRTWVDETSGHQMSGALRDKMFQEVRLLLGRNWKVRNEANHFHLRYRPVYGG